MPDVTIDDLKLIVRRNFDSAASQSILIAMETVDARENTGVVLAYLKHVSPKAYEKSEENCALRQLKEHLGEEARVEEKLDDAFARYLDMDPELNPFVDEITREGKGWRERGVSGQMIVDLAERLGVACTVMSQDDEVVLEHRPEKPNRNYRSIA